MIKFEINQKNNKINKNKIKFKFNYFYSLQGKLTKSIKVLKKFACIIKLKKISIYIYIIYAIINKNN